MVTTILGRKLGMTQVWSDDDKLLPVTVIEAGPCVVTQVKTEKRDGYKAVQIGFGDAKRVNKPMQGHFDKARVDAKKYLTEIRLGDGDEFKLGQTITVDALAEAKAVHVTGTSKGKGFQGAMKRHNFKGQRATHGVKKVHRHIGGTSGNTFPGRTFKGKKMAGQMGNERSTMRNIKVVRVDKENNLLLVNGAVPGPNGGYVIVRQTNKLG